MPSTDDAKPAPVHRLVGQPSQPIQLEAAVIAAKRMKLRSNQQLEIVTSLIFHVDRMQKVIKDQRRQLSDINAKMARLSNTAMSRPPPIASLDGQPPNPAGNTKEK